MAITRKNLFGKLNNSLFKSIESATIFCKLRGNPYVEMTHWINQLWQQEDSDLKHIFRHFELDADALERNLSEAVIRLPTGASTISDFSYHIELAIERSWIYASLECYSSRIRSGHLLIAMLTTMELRRALSTISSVFDSIPLDVLANDFNYITRSSVEANESEDDVQHDSAVPGQASNALNTNESSASLSQYSTDLTALAREGKIDPVTCSQLISTPRC